jgi:hypothetical protein
MVVLKAVETVDKLAELRVEKMVEKTVEKTVAKKVV